MKVVWVKNAQNQLKKIIKYIKQDSIQNAEIIRINILESTNKLSSHPEKYPIDKYKNKNDGEFRAYEIYRYRISYEITKDQINIVRVRSTDQEPLQY